MASSEGEAQSAAPVPCIDSRLAGASPKVQFLRSRLGNQPSARGIRYPDGSYVCHARRSPCLLHAHSLLPINTWRQYLQRFKSHNSGWTPTWEFPLSSVPTPSPPLISADNVEPAKFWAIGLPLRQGLVLGRMKLYPRGSCQRKTRSDIPPMPRRMRVKLLASGLSRGLPLASVSGKVNTPSRWCPLPLGDSSPTA
jgi:hypothetical protein